MTSIVSDVSLSKVIVGVDTHKHIHVAVAINQHGTRLGDRAVSADSGGYAQLAAWAQELGRVDRFGIEGTGSYGAGLTSYLRRGGHRVVEVNRGDRRSRRSNGKSDVLDAEAAARSILAGTSTTIPKTADGLVEMIRQVKVARDTARKGRTSAIVTVGAMIVNAPAGLRKIPRWALQQSTHQPVRPLPSLGDEHSHGFRQVLTESTSMPLAPPRHRDPLPRHRARRPHRPSLPNTARRLWHRSRLRGGASHRVRRQPRTDPFRSRIRETLRYLSDPGVIRTDQQASSLQRRAPTSQRGALPSSDSTNAIPPAHHRLRHSPHHRRPLKKGHHPLPETLPRPRSLPTRHDRPQNPTTHHPLKPKFDYRGINALAETVFGLSKTELIRPKGPWRNLDQVEYATLEYVDWFNHRRLLEPIGNIPPAEKEANHYSQPPTTDNKLKQNSLR